MRQDGSAASNGVWLQRKPVPDTVSSAPIRSDGRFYLWEIEDNGECGVWNAEWTTTRFRTPHAEFRIGMMDQNPYLTIGDVAKRFGINSTTVYRLAQRGALPGFKVGSQWRFSPNMLDGWVADQVTVEWLRAKDPQPSAGRRTPGRRSAQDGRAHGSRS